MPVAVLGSTGFSGSHISLELLNRGYTVVGIARNPEKLGKHQHYQPLQLDVAASSIAELVEALKGNDVLINAYNGPNNYSESSSGPAYRLTNMPAEHHLETTRRIVLASKAAGIGYFVMIGGTGSLSLPNEPFVTAADSREWWLAYRRAGADSEAATVHMEQRFGSGPIADSLRGYRNARIAILQGTASDADLSVIKENEDRVIHGDNWIPDLPVAARAAFMMFDGNTSFKWSFVSPPAMFVAGPKTGKYGVWVDEVPMSKEAKAESLDGNRYEGRLLGVSAADLAMAIVDEVEGRGMVGKHWSPVAEWEGDRIYSMIVTI
jgi:putative NADH-flavin reductase